MADFFTFALYDAAEGLTMSGIPSLDVARSIAADFYRLSAEWLDFIEEMAPAREVVFGFEDDRLMFGHSDTIGRFFGSIAIERRCGCCGHVRDRRTVIRADLNDSIYKR